MPTGSLPSRHPRQRRSDWEFLPRDQEYEEHRDA